MWQVACWKSLPDDLCTCAFKVYSVEWCFTCLYCVWILFKLKKATAGMDCGAGLCLASSVSPPLSLSPCGIFSLSSHMCLLFIDDLFFPLFFSLLRHHVQYYMLSCVFYCVVRATYSRLIVRDISLHSYDFWYQMSIQSCEEESKSTGRATKLEL